MTTVRYDPYDVVIDDDALVGRDEFDVIAEFGVEVPLRTIGSLFGIPEEDQLAYRSKTDARIATDGTPKAFDESALEVLAILGDYVDWRARHPSDDLMTELLNADVDEPGGTRRPLTRDEVVTYASMVAGAGSETATRLIGFTMQLLSEHPDQRALLVEDPSLIADAVEEVLRLESPSPVQARYVLRDVEVHGTTIPQGSAMLLINGAANRDERHFTDPDRFDMHRDEGPHLAFTGCTSVSVPPSPASKVGLRSRRSSADGRRGRSTPNGGAWPTPPACGAGATCQFGSADILVVAPPGAADDDGAVDSGLRERRLALLDSHFRSEVDHDWELCLATFKDVPRYEIVATGQVHEGRDAVVAYHRAQRVAFPDQRHENVRMHVADDDTIISEFDLLGTNTGEFLGGAPTGKAFRVAVVAVFSFDGDRITNERVYLDSASLLRQIGREDLLPIAGVEGFTAQAMR